MKPEDALQQLGLTLPPAPKPIGLYRPLTICGSLAFLAGHAPLNSDGKLITGRVGEELDVAAAAAAARQAGLAILATLRAGLGSLNRVKRLVKLLGFVQCTPGFTDQPAVINGCSQLLVEIFGPDDGVAARSAVGAPALPSQMAVEIEAIFELHSAD
jgi:enamine deaminase RidA (YjgF/YER057c/UK114 family)